MKQRHDQVKQARATKHVHHECMIQLKHLPEDDVQLLGEVDLLDGVRQVRLAQWVHQQTSKTSSDKLQVLHTQTSKQQQ